MWSGAHAGCESREEWSGVWAREDPLSHDGKEGVSGGRSSGQLSCRTRSAEARVKPTVVGQ